ncbi:hypothetical protein [Tessaracoccus sp. Z1128]
MRPRRRSTAGDLPAHLAEFTEADWPGVDWRARFDAWKAAQDRHTVEHGWPAGPLDRLYRRSLARSRHYGTPAHLGVTDWFGLPAERTRHSRRK